MTESQPPSDSFEDPLEQYDSPDLDDPIERALHEETVEKIQSHPFTTVQPETSIQDTVQLMQSKHIACVLVEEKGKLVGVFSDRDILNKVALEWGQMGDRPVSEVMNRNPVFVRESSSAAAALSVIAVSGYRHVPVLNDANEIVGIITPQRINRFLRECVPG